MASFVKKQEKRSPATLPIEDEDEDEDDDDPNNP